jgi:plasmid maintenance system antidote protein VapI
MAKKRPPVHPGEIPREKFLVPLRLRPYATALHVPRTRIVGYADSRFAPGAAALQEA